MSRHLARLVGFTAGYLFVALLERVALAAAAGVALEAPSPDRLEAADLDDVAAAHPCPTCCGIAA